MQKQSQHVVKGIILAALASVMWGISGTILQFISQTAHIPAAWFLSVRTLISGVIILTISFFVYGTKIFTVFKDRRQAFYLFAYGILGLALNLLTFYHSVQLGNSAMATILQYLSPLFIVLGTVVLERQWPLRSDLIAFVIALVGIFLSITRGDISQLSIPMSAFLWGLGSGITAAFYVVLPRPVVAEHPPFVVLGWGTLIAGVFFNIQRPLWVGAPALNMKLVLAIGAVILLGTILPFGTLLYSLHFAPADVVSIMDAVQPLATLVLSVIFFSLHLTWAEIIGSILVIVGIYVLQRGRRQVEQDTQQFE
ncbi:DMT family transporter [Ligilactobacillus saerimneri]|uniref:Drug/metabolite exporter family protein n=1 Tax=Ligilactobacillus saerimneri 30a TaxID=1227363 RepID=M5J578_9LACO|nr:DMT family transporter [Ligilactobacillus saerimneri]EKW99096.1 drug/metabolite exporter family protein [Ligilactobacillus saerimneri 30a]KRL73620.1 drug metabolite exporter family transporter [Ligilactobacillus saerimneri DSM 16049]MDY4003400.1 DMT family transporter [Ligilactobacillus saerimneri]